MTTAPDPSTQQHPTRTDDTPQYQGQTMARVFDLLRLEELAKKLSA